MDLSLVHWWICLLTICKFVSSPLVDLSLGHLWICLLTICGFVSWPFVDLSISGFISYPFVDLPLVHLTLALPPLQKILYSGTLPPSAIALHLQRKFAIPGSVWKWGTSASLWLTRTNLNLSSAENKRAINIGGRPRVALKEKESGKRIKKTLFPEFCNLTLF